MIFVTAKQKLMSLHKCNDKFHCTQDHLQQNHNILKTWQKNPHQKNLYFTFQGQCLAKGLIAVNNSALVFGPDFKTDYRILFKVTWEIYATIYELRSNLPMESYIFSSFLCIYVWVWQSLQKLYGVNQLHFPTGLDFWHHYYRYLL